VDDGARRPRGGPAAAAVAYRDSRASAWAAAVAASPFAETGLYDGAQDGYPAVEPGSEGPKLWHELTREDDQAGAAIRDPGACGA
jgi:hypothetical protein